MKIRTNVKAGGTSTTPLRSRNQAAAGVKVRTGVRAGGASTTPL